MRKRQAAHIEAPPEVPGHPRPNTCCLCWCGCCKCLWNEDRMERSERQTCTKLDSIEAADEQHPNLDDVLSWARSFEMMLRSLEGREIFREFLRSEYSEDNLLFWLACEELKKETDPSAVDEKARIIYEDYVSILSPKEVWTAFRMFANGVIDNILFFFFNLSCAALWASSIVGLNALTCYTDLLCKGRVCSIFCVEHVRYRIILPPRCYLKRFCTV
ncbi:regulator of G-protein signaling 17 isoform X2 [Dunckerocampus dactyliophorus]|nr:regulator of G-protein signaling 17 isoform X2 [Dunckerocampus dactyliophorus]